MSAPSGDAKRQRAVEDKENSFPRKKPANANEDEDSMIDDAFDMIGPPEDDLEDAPTDLLEVEEGVLGEAGKNWQRPAPPDLNPATDRLVFQQLEVDYNMGSPDPQFYPTDLKEVPVIRMFGVNEHGGSSAPWPSSPFAEF
jgi:DNA polymerase delta subunit 1